MVNHELVDLVMGKNRMYGDAEAEAASGVPLPSLRVLQGTGAIKSEKVSKEHGGFRRMWTEGEVLKAAIGAALGEHFAWNIRMVALVLARGDNFWDKAVLFSLSAADLQEPMDPESKTMVTEEHDIYADLIDRKFIFLRFPPLILSRIGCPVPDILLGMVQKEKFQNMSSVLLSPGGKEMAIQMFGEEKGGKVFNIHRLVMATHKNCVSKSSVNISMQVRAAWRRLHGMESKFYRDIFDQQGVTHHEKSGDE
ncbi:MAG: hypothetical protein H7839_20750 [Magnetococcus sp. YQC-5]